MQGHLIMQVNLVSWLCVSYFNDHAEINFFSTAIVCSLCDANTLGPCDCHVGVTWMPHVCNFKGSPFLAVASTYVGM